MSLPTGRLKGRAALALFLLLFLPQPRAAAANPPVVFALPANEEGLARYSRWKPITDYLSCPIPSRQVFTIWARRSPWISIPRPPTSCPPERRASFLPIALLGEVAADLFGQLLRLGP
jgi:hypothetical protein